MIPLSLNERVEWQDRIDKARAVRKTVTKWWDANLKAYAPSIDDDPDEYGSNLNTNRDFTLVERKKADLFYQRPDVTAVPSPLMAGQEPLLDTHTAILNESLGRDGVDAKSLVHQVLFDVLCPSGTGWTVMGYDSATQDTQTIDPMTGQPMNVPVPVYEACYWRWLSARRGLIPHDHRSTIWDDAPWLGYDFEMPVRSAKRKGWVPEDYTGDAPDAELHYDHGAGNTGGDAVCRGVLIFYKSSLYRDDIVHPQHYTQLVLIEGQDQPAEHKDSPYQTLDPQGKLTADSMLGNPIHPLTIRTLTDSAYVPSDCTISRTTVNELNTFRRQMVEFRDASVLRWMYNVDTLPTDALNKIVRSPIGGFIGVPGDAFVGEGAIKELPHGSIPRENFTVNDYLDNDLARTHALDASQSGVDNSGGDTTATEESIKQANVNARLGFERGIVLDWYCKGVSKYSALIQRFFSVEQAAAIVGQQAAQLWDGFRKAVPATLAFTALPDSSLRMDLASDRKRVRDDYTFLANDPFINRPVLLKEIMPKMGYTQKVINPQPPQKGPDPAKPSFAFKGEDLNPLAPQFAIVMEILKQSGVNVSPQAVQEAQAGAVNSLMAAQVTNATGQGEQQPNTEHGGKVAQLEGLSKHAVEMTGNLPGTSGQPASGLVQ